MTMTNKYSWCVLCFSWWEFWKICHKWNYFALLLGNSENPCCYNNRLLLWKLEKFRVAKHKNRVVLLRSFFKHLSIQGNQTKQFVRAIFQSGTA